MAQLLRSQPPRPHLSAPVVAPGGPKLVTTGEVFLWKRGDLWRGNGRVRVIPPHLAKAIVAPGGPQLVTSLTEIHQQRLTIRPVKRRLPPPVVAPGGPVVPGSTIKLQRLRIKPVGHRTAPPVIVLTPPFLPNIGVHTTRLTIKPVHRLLPPPVVSPGKAVVPGSSIHLQKLRITVPNRPKLAPAALITPPPPAFVFTVPTHLQRLLVRPVHHLLPPPIVGQPLVPFLPPAPFTHLQRLIIRPVIHRLAGGIVAPGGPVVPGQTIRLVRLRILPVHTRLAPPIAAPGAPVVPGASVHFVRIPAPRRVIPAHLAPAIIGAAAVITPGGLFIDFRTGDVIYRLGTSQLVFRLNPGGN